MNENTEPLIHNVFENPEPESPAEEPYPDLVDYISFGNFAYDSKSYQQQEIELLQPQLEALGYTDIEWLPGESDRFGPLTRLCKTTDPDGNEVTFIYG